MTGLMAGKRGLIMGLANDKSIAWGIAKALADAGAELAFSYQGEALKKRVDPIVHEKGFEGRLVILGEPGIARGDCHIEWADGGILRDRKALEKQVDASIRNYIQARAANVAKARDVSEAEAVKDTNA